MEEDITYLGAWRSGTIYQITVHRKLLVEEGIQYTLVRDTSVNRRQTTKLVVRVTELFRFSLSSNDVTQAYLQNAKKLMQDVFINLTKEFGSSPDLLIQLLKLVYELSNSKD